jgi:sulfur-oxidizing protein SoxZ
MADTGKTLMRLPREYAKGDLIEVKTMVFHPNDNGRKQDPETGQYIAEWYIRSITVLYGDEKVMTVNTSSAISQNPYFTFQLNAVRSAPLRVEWEDSKGGRYTQTADVQV